MESSLGSSAADDVLLASTADSRADTSHVSESSASARGGGDGDDAELVRLRAQVVSRPRRVNLRKPSYES